jgi:hypothetical protein
VEIHTDQFQVAPDILGEDEDETTRLRQMAEGARSFVTSHRWAPPIGRQFLAYGLGGVIALFLFEFEHPVSGTSDRQLWTVVGDLPSAYFVVDQATTASAALELYCELMDDWAAAVMEGHDLAEVFPIEAEPTQEHAQMLLSRVSFIREKILPDLNG